MDNINQFAEVYLDIKTRKVDHAFEYIIPSKLKNGVQIKTRPTCGRVFYCQSPKLSGFLNKISGFLNKT